MSVPTSSTFASQVSTVFQRDDPGAAAKPIALANLQVIERMYEAFLDRDLEALLGGMDENVEWRINGPAEVPFVGACRGRGEVAVALQKGFAAVSDQDPEVEAVQAEGDAVTVRGFERGVHQPTGNRYETHWVHRFTLRDGKVVRFEEEFEATPFMEALREPSA